MTHTVICYRVLSQGKRTSDATRSLLTRIVQLSITSSGITAISALTLAILCLTTGTPAYWAALHVCLLDLAHVHSLVHLPPRLVANSCLFALNHRNLLRDGATTNTSKAHKHATNTAIWNAPFDIPVALKTFGGTDNDNDNASGDLEAKDNITLRNALRFADQDVNTP